jgi:rare lipoprotein A
MSRQRITVGAAVLVAVLAQAGCETGDQTPGSNDQVAQTGASGGFFGQSKTPVAQDVESPDVFSLMGKGLWDGRPSLGGVWVAHSSVTDPERVIIRNKTNGKSIVGALFRRERETPGPSLQVSSDAAEKLGLLAGQPTEMSVIALRREELPEPEPEPEIAAIPETEGATETAATNSEISAENAPPPNPKRAVIGAAEGGAAVAVEKPARKGLFGFLKKKPRPAEATPEVADATEAPTTGEIEQKPLDPIVATATAGIAQAEAEQPAAAGAAASQPIPEPSATGLRKSYVQIGIFSTEVNASFAVDQMKAEGMTATVKPGTSQGKAYWRVIVGPAATAAERDALIARIKQVGYRDAFPVKQ